VGSAVDSVDSAAAGLAAAGLVVEAEAAAMGEKAVEVENTYSLLPTTRLCTCIQSNYLAERIENHLGLQKFRRLWAPQFVLVCNYWLNIRDC
jgi:hypothetical protein